jgi:3-oxoacyl-[acyl-carrier-protein] synthase II
MQRRVCITGMGVISALGDSPGELHEALCEGRHGFDIIRRFDPKGSDHARAAEVKLSSCEKYLGQRNLRPLDRTAQLLASAAGRALVDAGWSQDLLTQEDVGLAVGTMYSSVHTIAEFDRRGLLEGPCYTSPMDFANTVINAAAGQTAIWHGLRGVNSTVSTGSSSGLSAIAYAAEQVRSGKVSAILAGGVEELSFESWYGFSRAGMLCDFCELGSPHAIPFGARRNGFGLGEGAGLLMLEDLDFAVARGAWIVGEIQGHGSRSDPSNGENPEQQISAIAQAIRLALSDAVLGPDDIDGVSASANGSESADRCEALALHAVFQARSRELPVTAIKGMTGETLGASGPIQTVAAIEAMRTGMMCGIPGLVERDRELPLWRAGPTTGNVLLRNCLINAVGLDGACCSLVLARGPHEASVYRREPAQRA